MRGQRGFSLLEVLVAFVVLAAALAVLLPTVAGLMRGAGSATAHWQAAEIAQSELAQIGVTAPLVPGRREGAWGRWRWRATVTPWRDPAGRIDAVGAFYLVEIEVVDTVRGEIAARMTTIKRADTPQ